MIFFGLFFGTLVSSSTYSKTYRAQYTSKPLIIALDIVPVYISNLYAYYMWETDHASSGMSNTYTENFGRGDLSRLGEIPSAINFTRYVSTYLGDVYQGFRWPSSDVLTCGKRNGGNGSSEESFLGWIDANTIAGSQNAYTDLYRSEMSSFDMGRGRINYADGYIAMAANSNGYISKSKSNYYDLGGYQSVNAQFCSDIDMYTRNGSLELVSFRGRGSSLQSYRAYICIYGRNGNVWNSICTETSSASNYQWVIGCPIPLDNGRYVYFIKEQYKSTTPKYFVHEISISDTDSTQNTEFDFSTYPRIVIFQYFRINGIGYCYGNQYDSSGDTTQPITFKFTTNSPTSLSQLIQTTDLDKENYTYSKYLSPCETPQDAKYLIYTDDNNKNYAIPI